VRPAATVVFVRRRALRRLLWAPGELGLVRAYVSGDMQIEGDIFALLDLPEVIDRVAHHQLIGLSLRQRLAAAVTAARIGAVGLPPRPPAEEIRRRRGRLHSISRDAQSVAHHYDAGNGFYRLILGPSMVYSCAYWAQESGPVYGLDEAQRDKCELVCTKLGLHPGMRLLDVGCGWGSLAIHAATRHGVSVVGVTVSKEQAALARERVDAAGVGDLVEIRLQDYRDVHDGPYDAVSSVGMSEHVGSAQLRAYSQTLMDLLRPGGRLLNHAIASVRPLPPASNQPGFIDRYIFPTGKSSHSAPPSTRWSRSVSRCGTSRRCGSTTR
jgi:cyclopropane-fatty-acyl-phospholipid synthase